MLRKNDWPADALEAVTACPWCGGSGATLRHAGLADVTFNTAPGRFDMYECATCGAGYLNPRPTRQSIGLAYARYYTHSAAAPPVPESTALARLRRRLANGYRNARYGADARPALAVGAALLKTLPAQRIVLDSYYRFLPRAHGHLLDFGCGNGGFLDIARGLGWRCTGMDFDPGAVDAARRQGHAVIHGGPEALNGIGETFDAVTVSHVLEHMHDPQALLSALFAVLKPGGGIYVETPNFGSICHRHFGRHWRGIEAPRHLAIPAAASLRHALTAAGFTAIILHQRPDVFAPIYKRSAALSEGQDSESPAALARPNPPRQQAREASQSSGMSEYLSVTAQKPSP